MKKPLPFEFILDYLYPLTPVIKPMFGCYALYAGEKIIFVLRDRKDHEEDNGVWIATEHEHHESLKKELPSMRKIFLFGGEDTVWQNIPADSDHFESEVIRACELVKKKDKRIGRIPNRKRK